MIARCADCDAPFELLTGSNRAYCTQACASTGGKTKRTVADRPDDLAWQAEANCLGVDPDLFFPDRGASTREAKEVCHGCEVRMQCLEYVLTHGEKFGIWGGMSERERRRIRRQRAAAVKGA